MNVFSKYMYLFFQFIGPCYVDITGPTFTPPIKVIHSNGHLIASWDASAFEDSEDPYPLNFEYSIGENRCFEIIDALCINFKTISLIRIPYKHFR